MHKRTNKGRLLLHPEFRLEWDETIALTVDGEWLVSYLDNQISHGTVFAPGSFLRLGCGLTRVDEKSDGYLTLSEPDFSELPMRFTNGVTVTLRHLRLQKSVAESVGFESRILFPDLRESGICCVRYGDSVDFIMERSVPAGSDSGWFIGCADPTHDHNDPAQLRRVSLYEQAVKMPDCVPFLALPPGMMALINGNLIEISFENSKLQILPGSYLARKTGDQALRKDPRRGAK
jgi:hypothetical protein